MTLPSVDFICLDALPRVRRTLPEVGSQTLSVRELNADPDSGERSWAITFDAGFAMGSGYWSCDMEMFILDGQLDLGGETLERYGYVFVPSGVLIEELLVGSQGATALLFMSSPARFTPADQDASGAARHRMVQPVHIADLDWEQPRTPGFPVGAGRKTLRDDPETAEGFWILAVLPHWSTTTAEWHTFAEEAFVLEGEMETPVGLMRAGCYLAHGPGEASLHGPLRSRHGFLQAIRAKGPLGTHYVPATDELSGPWR